MTFCRAPRPLKLFVSLLIASSTVRVDLLGFIDRRSAWRGPTSHPCCDNEEVTGVVCDAQE